MSKHNKKNLVGILIFNLILAASPATSQNFYFKKYGVGQGLPTDIVKYCAQDSSGYFWIATDAGIVRYDGVNFKSYPKATQSNYAKGFLSTKGRLFAFGDLDFLEIHNLGDSVRFTSLCSVAREANDSSLTYPKLIYEDKNENLWISESQSVVKMIGKKLHRYEFSLEDRTTEFLRSFQFFEDKKGDLFAVSIHGNVFKYNFSTDLFESVPVKFPKKIEFLAVERSEIFIGSEEGLFTAALKAEGGFELPVLKFKIPLVAFGSPMGENKYFIGTRGAQQFIVDLKSKEINPLPILIRDVNHVYRSKENDLWISSSDGLYLVKENVFEQINPAVNTFIEGICEDEQSGLLYYTVQGSLYSYNWRTKQTITLLSIPNGYFQDLAFVRNGLWLANGFKMMLFRNGKIQKEFDFSAGRKFITEVEKDKNGNIWFLIPGQPKVFRIDEKDVLHEIAVKSKANGFNTSLFTHNEGIYLTRSGSSEYLFYKAHKDSMFHDVSVPMRFVAGTDFHISSVAKLGDQLWLGSNEGLLRLKQGRLEKADSVNIHLNQPVQTVQILDSARLIMSSFKGLIVFDITKGNTALLGENFGLPSSSIPRHGIMVRPNKEVVVGTSRGLSISRAPISAFEKSPKSKFLQLKIGDKKQSLLQKGEIEYGQLVSLTISSITFPENLVHFQYRLSPQSEWIDVEGNTINFSGLLTGTQQLEVRSRKLGLYTWSDPSYLVYETIPPFWQQWWFYAPLTVGAVVIGVVSSKTLRRANLIRQRRLELIINKKTRELRKTNTDLVNLNAEKNNLIAIVAHDLRSPLSEVFSLANLIKVSSNPEGETEEFLSLIETSATRGMNLISKILDIEAIDSRKFKLNSSKVEFSTLLKKVCERFQESASNKNIQLDVKIEDQVHVMADEVLLHQVVENLVSNAIKFSPSNRKVQLALLTKNNTVIAEVRDQGPGLSLEDQKKLFGKFQKLSARPTGGESSSGLGLYISKSFVEAMNGQLWCESETGKGTSFFVSFPMSI